MLSVTSLVTNQNRDLISRLRSSPCNVVGLSGGKDSVATCILLHRLDIPFETVTAEVWWKKGVTGEQPEHFEFIHGVLADKLGKWGVKMSFVSSEKTAYESMTHKRGDKSKEERRGKYNGFPLSGKCDIQSCCKISPIKRYYKASGKIQKITGICADENKRAISATKKGDIPLLSILGIKELDTYPLCASEKLLSPVYDFSNRGGCWFCPNAAISEIAHVYFNHHELWEEIMEIQRMPNKVSESFNRRGETLFDIERRILGGYQQKLFYGQFFR